MIQKSATHSDVLLLVPPGINYNTPPLGLLYLAATLEENDISVKVLDAALNNLNLEQTFSEVRKISPKIVGITVCTPDYPIIDKFACLLKRAIPQIIMVFGGPHPTLDPEGVLASEYVDFAVRGEGEYTFWELCRIILNGESSQLSSVQGLSYRSDSRETVNNPDRPLIQDLDELPLPSRHLVPLMRYRNYGRVYKRKPVGVMITSRGCPLQCIFCAHEIFGRRYRFMSAKRMIEEIKLLQRDYGVKEILFREDNFTANRKRVLDFCDIILREKIDITWMCLADANSITEQLAEKMKEAGCWHVGIGVESGNQEIQKVLKKNLNLEHVKRVFDFLHKAGLKTLAFFMIGNYADDSTTIKQTIKYAKGLNTDFAIFTVTTPFPKTELFDMAVRDRLITNFDFGQITNNPSIFKQKAPILRTKSLTSSQLRNFQLRAIVEFYLRPKQLIRILRDKSLARAFLGIQPASYTPNTKIISQIEQEFICVKDGARDDTQL
jgi:radical SAM superfamily enzyme YgiQ (UPF0313 family)